MHRPSVKMLFLVLAAFMLTFCSGCDGILGPIFDTSGVGCCYPLGAPGSAHWSTQQNCSGSSDYWFSVATNQGERDALAACQRSGPRKAMESTPDLYLKENRPAAFRLVAYSHGSENAESNSSCLSTCSDVTDNKCTVANLPSSSSKPLSTLVQQVSTNNDASISSADLMKMFGQSKDPCKRGSTAISATTLVNEGASSCEVKAEFAGTHADLTLAIPKRLEGEWSSRVYPMRIEFKRPDRAPSVIFHNSHGKLATDLNADFGGEVLAAETDGSRFFLRTKGGCVGASIEAR